MMFRNVAPALYNRNRLRERPTIQLSGNNLFVQNQTSASPTLTSPSVSSHSSCDNDNHVQNDSWSSTTSTDNFPSTPVSSRSFNFRNKNNSTENDEADVICLSPDGDFLNHSPHVEMNNNSKIDAISAHIGFEIKVI